MGNEYSRKIQPDSAMDTSSSNFDPAHGSPEAHAALAATYSSDLIMVTDASGRALWANAAFEALTGYALDELIGRKPGEVLQGPATDQDDRARLRAAIRDGVPTRVEIENYRKTGERFVVEIDLRPIRDPDGAIVRFVSVQRETTARRMRKRDLDERRRLARELVDASSAGIWIAEPVIDLEGRAVDFRFVDVNPAAERLLQRLRVELVGATMLTLFPGADQSGVFARYVEVMDTGRGAGFEVEYAYDGLSAWYRVTALRTQTGHLAVSFLDISSEKQASNALDRARKDLEDLATQLPGALFSLILRTNGSVELSSASATLADLIGYDVARDGFGRALARTTRSDLALAVDALASAAHGSFMARLRYAHPIRGERWFEMFARVQPVAGGARLAAYVHDVTEGHHAREAAEQASARLAKLADTVPGVLFQTIFSATGAISHPFASLGAQELLGLTQQQLQHDPGLRFSRIPLADRQGYFELIERSRATLEPFSITIRYEHPTRGEIALWVNAKPERLPDGGTLMHKFAADVTDMVRHAEELLAAKEAAEALGRRLGLAASAGRIGFWEFDTSTGGLRWDEAMFELYGSRPEGFRSSLQDWSDLVNPDDLEAASAELGRAVEERRQLAIQFRIIRPDGRIRHIVGRAAAYEAIDGRLLILGVNWDATEFVEAQKRADAGARAKAAFLANMSHEIRTPMNGVVALAGALASTRLDPQQREMVDLVRSSGETLERLLSDILDMSRIEEGKLSLEAAPFDLRAAVDGAARIMQVRTDDKGLAFEIGYTEMAIGPFIGDAVRVRQILSNLISNAIKLTDRGGVRVVVDVEEAGGSCEVRFDVVDTGIGFDDETARRLFSRFEQADASITRTYGGSGLGLAITKSLCDAMGGSIEVQSAPGIGSRFKVCLPLPRAIPRRDVLANSEAPRNETHEALAVLDGLRVLLAEDHPTNQRVVALILDPFGVDVTVACNGAEAVDLFSVRPFDVILMDMQMPVLDGLSATRAIRAMERARNSAPIPIVMLSANALPEHQRRRRPPAAICTFLSRLRPTASSRLWARRPVSSPTGRIAQPEKIRPRPRAAGQDPSARRRATSPSISPSPTWNAVSSARRPASTSSRELPIITLRDASIGRSASARRIMPGLGLRSGWSATRYSGIVASAWKGQKYQASMRAPCAARSACIAAWNPCMCASENRPRPIPD
jgi:PAS domain S-box-containing protein